MKTFALLLRQPVALPTMLIILTLSAFLVVGLSHPFPRLVAAVLLVGASVLLGMLLQQFTLALAVARGELAILKRCTREDHNHS